MEKAATSGVTVTPTSAAMVAVQKKPSGGGGGGGHGIPEGELLGTLALVGLIYFTAAGMREKERGRKGGWEGGELTRPARVSP